MSNEGYKFQISGDIGNAMFVFRGDDVAEVEKQSEDAKAALERIYDNFLAMQQIVSVKEAFSEKKGFGGKPAGGSAPAGGSKPSGPRRLSESAPASEAPDGSYTCDHGAMKKLDYKKGDGTRVHGWYCQSKDKDWKKKCATVKLPGHGE